MAILVKYATKHSSYVAIYSSCYSIFQRNLNNVIFQQEFISEVAEVLQSIPKVDYKVNFFIGRTNKLRR